MYRSLTAAVVGLSLVTVAANSSVAGTKWTVGQQWPASQRVSMNQIDHSVWNNLLKKYVDGNGYVDYQSWKAGGERQLDQYLSELSKASTSKSGSKPR